MTTQPTVLFVEDDPNILEMFDLLEEEGFKIFKAADGVQALEAVKKYKIDVVVTDINMPNMNGVELLEALVQLEPAPLVFLFSGEVMDEPESYIQLGAKQVLVKPDDLFRLPDILKVALGIEDESEAA